MAHSKRDATTAGLPLNPLPNMGQRRADPSNSDEEPFPTFTAIQPATVDTDTDPGAPMYTSSESTGLAPPFLRSADETSSLHSRAFSYSHYGNDQTVHTITFKLWNQSSWTNKELFIQETRQDGNTVSYDPEHFFQKLVGNQAQANRLSDYWRSFYDVPTRHSTVAAHPSVPLPFSTSPSGTSSLSTSHSTGELALALYGKLFGPHGHFDPHEAVNESSWPATELSQSERDSLHSLLTKLSNSPFQLASTSSLP